MKFTKIKKNRTRRTLHGDDSVEIQNFKMELPDDAKVMWAKQNAFKMGSATSLVENLFIFTIIFFC